MPKMLPSLLAALLLAAADAPSGLVPAPERFVPPPRVIDRIQRGQAEIYRQQLESRLNVMEERLLSGDLTPMQGRELQQLRAEQQRIRQLLER